MRIQCNSLPLNEIICTILLYRISESERIGKYLFSFILMKIGRYCLDFVLQFYVENFYLCFSRVVDTREHFGFIILT